MEEEKKGTGTLYLHLGAAVLEPELDLVRLQAELPAERGALVLVGVRALLEHPAVTGEHAPLHSSPSTITTTTTAGHDEETAKEMETKRNKRESYASSC